MLFHVIDILSVCVCVCELRVFCDCFRVILTVECARESNSRFVASRAVGWESASAHARERARYRENSFAKEISVSLWLHLDRACVRDAFFFGCYCLRLFSPTRPRACVLVLLFESVASGKENLLKILVCRAMFWMIPFFQCVFLFALFTNSFFLSVFFSSSHDLFWMFVIFLFNLSFDMHKIVLTLTSSACVYVCLWDFVFLRVLFFFFTCVLNPKKDWNSRRCLVFTVYFLSEKNRLFLGNFQKKKTQNLRKSAYFIKFYGSSRWITWHLAVKVWTRKLSSLTPRWRR